MPDSRQTVTSIGIGEQLRLDDSRPVGQREEFHQFTCDLLMDAVLDNQAAAGNCLADMLADEIRCLFMALAE
jgi:hypothetical protein